MDGMAVGAPGVLKYEVRGTKYEVRSSACREGLQGGLLISGREFSHIMLLV